MAEEYKLLKTNKNYFFEILKKTGLEPANFSWTNQQVPDTSVPPPYKNIIVPKLEYLDGEYYFQFEKYSCTFSPGQTKAVEHINLERSDEQLFYVRQWAGYLKRQIEAPDLWAEMEKYKVAFSLALPEQLLNEPIPTYEAEKISEQLSSLADKIEELFALTNKQNQFVHNKLNYLAEAAKRQRSVDWVHTSIGVFVTIAMGLALVPDQAKELWELMRSLMSGFIHLIGP